ncbi:MAG: hypothetical protein HWE39_07905 [Oceanospirillaceae bacterium]|nr:hypothetical protein [Oceanospirillaceae bacterium]
MKYLLIMAFTVLVSGCTPSHYLQQNWAQMSVDQAHAVCLSEIQANPMLGHDVCMNAKGWQAVY